MGRPVDPYPVSPLAQWHSVCGEKAWPAGSFARVSAREGDDGPVFIPLLVQVSSFPSRFGKCRGAAL